MPSRIDCGKTLLLKQRARLQQLEELLRQCGVIEAGKQNWLLDELKQPEFAFHLEAEAQEQLRSKPSLKQLRQEYRLAFKVTTAPTQKLDQIEALWFSSPYVEACFEVLRGWVREVFRILVDEIWQGHPTAKQLRDAKDEIILPLIRLEENNFKHTIRSDVLTDCLAFGVEFPEVQFRVREQDFNRLTAELTEKWEKHIEAMVCRTEQRTPSETEQAHVDVATQLENNKSEQFFWQQKLDDPERFPYMTDVEVAVATGYHRGHIGKLAEKKKLKRVALAQEDGKRSKFLVTTESVRHFLKTTPRKRKK